MDASRQQAPYRCVPLVTANGFGWEILSPVGVTAIWNGSQDVEGVVILPDPGTQPPAHTHFGEGVLTFSVPFLFRTNPEVDLVVQGPINRPKDAIAPLTGVVESDWGPFSFTMNWQFTRPNTAVRFKKGEPICHIFPVNRGMLEAVQPKVLPLSANPELEAKHAEWVASRNKFNAELKVPGSPATVEKWQKHYQRGIELDGNSGPPSHRIKTKLRPFLPIAGEAPAEKGKPGKGRRKGSNSS
jgi:Family of unknown function (DUF6065)